MKADFLKPAGYRAGEYRALVDRRVGAPDRDTHSMRKLREGVHDFNRAAASYGEETSGIHPAFDPESREQDEHLEEAWQHLMSHYFEVVSPWVREIYRDLSESDRIFLDKEIEGCGIPLRRMDEGALLCLRSSLMLMRSGLLESCGADEACIVFEALKSVEIAGKSMLEKPFTERKDELKKKAREICDTGNCLTVLDGHLKHLRPLDKRYLPYEQLCRTLESVSKYCDCSKVIHGTRHLG